MLGGGDYDGDTAQIIWQPEIVQPFRNSDPKYASSPEGIMDDLQKGNKPMKNFLDRKLKPDKIAEELTPFLLGGLQDTSLVGTYSNWHLISTYRNGYDHPETIRLAWMWVAKYRSKSVTNQLSLLLGFATF
jgi:RNA-dependent RNA polymerase